MAAYHARSPILTSMTPARSPNMKSGWPPETMASRFWPCQPAAAGVVATTLNVPSVTASTWLPASIPLCTVFWMRRRASASALLPPVSASISALTSSPAASPSTAFASRSTSSRSAISDRKRTEATTIRKIRMRMGMERFSKRLGSKQTAIGRRSDDARIPSDIGPLLVVAGKSRAFGRAPRVRSGHADPPNIPVDDPATPHIRIIHKESKVIRLVQRQSAKRPKIAENRRLGLVLCQRALDDVAQVGGQVFGA